jgi:aminoglycoside phosphotransferase (APT) family kinase protein
MSDAVRTAVARLTSARATDQQIKMRPDLPHQSNRLYDVWISGKHLIAKEYVRTDREAAPRREFAALQWLEQLDVAPRPVFFQPELGPVVLYEFLDGSMWDRRRPNSSELVALVGTWSQFQRFAPDELWLATGQGQSRSEIALRLRAPIRAYAYWADQHEDEHRQLARMCLDAMERALAASAELIPTDVPLCFCHTDPRFANVIARPDGRLGLVDWEDSGLRDPAREVADLMSHPNQEDLVSEPGWSAFLEAYLATRPDDSGFERRLRGYVGVFPVFWLGVLFREGMQRSADGTLGDWRINELEPNQRLRRYLARAQAWPEGDLDATLGRLGDARFF